MSLSAAIADVLTTTRTIISIVSLSLRRQSPVELTVLLVCRWIRPAMRGLPPAPYV